MKHFSEEEWIEYRYGESGEREQMQEHLTQCSECAALAEALASDLAELRLDRLSEAEPRRDAE